MLYSAQVPPDHNLRFLPLMFFLPEDLIVRCPTLRVIPRRLKDIFGSEEILNVIDSDQFLSEIIDAGAAMIFPHFGFGGWKEHYTGYSPVYELSYHALRPVCKLLEKNTA